MYDKRKAITGGIIIYEYKFHRLGIKVWRGLGYEYREIIVEAAAEGWELVQILTISDASMSGSIKDYEIIFKRKIK